MRMSIIIASGCVMLSFGYRYFIKGNAPTGKTVFAWSTILVMLSVMAQTPVAELADTIAYIITLIIVLNDGYDYASSL